MYRSHSLAILELSQPHCSIQSISLYTQVVQNSISQVPQSYNQLLNVPQSYNLFINVPQSYNQFSLVPQSYNQSLNVPQTYNSISQVPQSYNQISEVPKLYYLFLPEISQSFRIDYLIHCSSTTIVHRSYLSYHNWATVLIEFSIQVPQRYTQSL